MRLISRVLELVIRIPGETAVFYAILENYLHSGFFKNEHMTKTNYDWEWSCNWFLYKFEIESESEDLTIVLCMHDAMQYETQHCVSGL